MVDLRISAASPPDTTRTHHSQRSRLLPAALHLTVLAIAVHSLALGLSLLFFPHWALSFVGWPYSGPMFWPSQAGLFLIILGVTYAWAIRLRPLLWLIIGSKFSAVVFLLLSVPFLEAPRLVALLGCGDGAMGLAVALLFWAVRRAEAAAARERSGATR